MQAEIKPWNAGFQPFNLTISVETEGDLLYLIHIFNVSRKNILKFCKDECSTTGYPVPNESDCTDKFDIWRTLNRKYEELQS